MANKPQKRCLNCGRLFEIDAPAKTTLNEDFAADVPQKDSSFCLICEAKIKKEAKDTQKEPKPM